MTPNRRAWLHPGREAVLWGLIFALPPGFGIAGYAAHVVGDPFSPLAVGAGLLVAGTIFAFVVVASTDPDPGEPID